MINQGERIHRIQLIIWLINCAFVTFLFCSLFFLFREEIESFPLPVSFPVFCAPVAHKHYRSTPITYSTY